MNEKDFMKRLNNLDDSSVEEIAENYPALNENAKKRILKQSLIKSGFTDYDIEVEEESDEETDFIEESAEEDELSVSGIEQYKNKISWHKYAGSAVAMLIAVVGITSVVLLHRNMNENDDFDISNPPFIDIPQEQMTEIVSGSYIDNGYRAGGFDYANINGYEGSVQYGMTTATEPPVTEAVINTAPETSEQNGSYQENPPEDSHADPVVTAPPPTAPPTTAPPPVTTAPDVTQPVSSEAQKTFLDSLYYVEVSGNSEYMGFNFSPDGSLTKYVFDEYGNAVSDTAVTVPYEIIENQFSYTSSDGFKRTGTIVNPNDTGNFIVKFDDGELYNFSMQRPNFKVMIFLEGTNWFWNEDGYNTLEIEFADSVSGNYIIYPSDATTAESTKIPFTYEKNGYEITFRMEDPSVNVLKAELIVPEPFEQYVFGVAELEKVTLSLEYADGSIKYFHNGN